MCPNCSTWLGEGGEGEKGTWRIIGLFRLLQEADFVFISLTEWISHILFSWRITYFTDILRRSSSLNIISNGFLDPFCGPDCK